MQVSLDNIEIRVHYVLFLFKEIPARRYYQLGEGDMGSEVTMEQISVRNTGPREGCL